MKRDVIGKRRLFLSVLLIGFLVIGMIGVVSNLITLVQGATSDDDFDWQSIATAGTSEAQAKKIAEFYNNPDDVAKMNQLAVHLKEILSTPTGSPATIQTIHDALDSRVVVKAILSDTFSLDYMKKYALTIEKGTKGYVSGLTKDLELLYIGLTGKSVEGKDMKLLFKEKERINLLITTLYRDKFAAETYGSKNQPKITQEEKEQLNLLLSKLDKDDVSSFLMQYLFTIDKVNFYDFYSSLETKNKEKVIEAMNSMSDIETAKKKIFIAIVTKGDEDMAKGITLAPDFFSKLKFKLDPNNQEFGTIDNKPVGLMTQEGTPIRAYGDGNTGLASLRVESVDGKQYIVYKNKVYDGGGTGTGTEIWVQNGAGDKLGVYAYIRESKLSYDLVYMQPNDKDKIKYVLGDIGRGNDGRKVLTVSPEPNEGVILSLSEAAWHVSVNYEVSTGITNGRYGYMPSDTPDGSKTRIGYTFGPHEKMTTRYSNAVVYGGLMDEKGNVGPSYAISIYGDQMLSIADVKTGEQSDAEIEIVSDGPQKGAVRVTPGTDRVDVYDLSGTIYRNGFSVYNEKGEAPTGKEGVVRLFTPAGQVGFEFEKTGETNIPRNDVPQATNVNPSPESIKPGVSSIGPVGSTRVEVAPTTTTPTTCPPGGCVTCPLGGSCGGTPVPGLIPSGDYLPLPQTVLPTPSETTLMPTTPTTPTEPEQPATTNPLEEVPVVPTTIPTEEPNNPISAAAAAAAAAAITGTGGSLGSSLSAGSTSSNTGEQPTTPTEPEQPTTPVEDTSAIETLKRNNPTIAGVVQQAYPGYVPKEGDTLLIAYVWSSGCTNCVYFKQDASQIMENNPNLKIVLVTDNTKPGPSFQTFNYQGQSLGQMVSGYTKGSYLSARMQPSGDIKLAPVPKK